MKAERLTRIRQYHRAVNSDPFMQEDMTALLWWLDDQVLTLLRRLSHGALDPKRVLEKRTDNRQREMVWQCPACHAEANTPPEIQHFSACPAVDVEALIALIRDTQLSGNDKT